VELLPPGLENEEGLVRISQDITEILAYRPGEYYVKSIVRPRLARPNEGEAGIEQAPIPPRLIPKGMADESLVAQLIVEKILFHTPIYRFGRKLRQTGIDFIRENSLRNWFHTAAEAMRPIYNLLVEDMLSQPYIQADESPIAVLTKNKPGAICGPSTPRAGRRSLSVRRLA